MLWPRWVRKEERNRRVGDMTVPVGEVRVSLVSLTLHQLQVAVCEHRP